MRRVCGGFSLLEALLASVLLTAGLSATMWALGVSLRVVSAAERRATAASLVEEKLEEARSIPFDEVVDETEGGDEIGVDFVTARSLSVRPLDDDLKELRATVTWNEGDDQVSLSGRSIICRW